MLFRSGQSNFFFAVPAGTTLARWAMYDDDVGAQNDVDLFLFQQVGANFVLIANSGGGTSEEEINIANPAPGNYVLVALDFATETGPTPISVFNYNLNGTDAGNTTLTLPASAVAGATESVTVEWTGLPANTRSLGILSHSDGTATIGTTELLVNTQ